MPRRGSRGTALAFAPSSPVRSYRFDQSVEEPSSVPGEGCRIQIRGTVQGVGFRPWVYRMARDSAITGRVRNHTGGVTIDAFGDRDAMRRFVSRPFVSL